MRLRQLQQRLRPVHLPHRISGAADGCHTWRMTRWIAPSCISKRHIQTGSRLTRARVFSWINSLRRMKRLHQDKLRCLLDLVVAVYPDLSTTVTMRAASACT